MHEIIPIDLNGVNCFLVEAEDGFILFDTGGHTVLDKKFTNRRGLLEQHLEKHGCKPGKLKLIVLTHGDNDHVANAAYLREKFQSSIAMHPYDVELVANPTIGKVMESFRYKSFIYKSVFQFMKRLIKKVSIKMLDNYEKFKPDLLINEGDSLSAYGLEAKILHIPGHTKGSIGILTESGDLIVGDTQTNMKKPTIAPNAIDFKELKESVDRLKDFEIKMVYPGHGEPFELGQLTIK